MTRIDDDIALIERSALFAREWYVKQYPGVSKRRHGAAEHYLRTGAALMHDPSPDFSTRRYLLAYPDVKTAGINPLVHYLRHGRHERRSLFPAGEAGEDAAFGLADLDRSEHEWNLLRDSRLFDPHYYLDRYPDVAQNGIDPMRHYLEHGTREGRLPNPYFDPRYYRAIHQAPSDPTNPLVHYATTPDSDRASTSGLFDGAFYACRYPEVAVSGLKPLEHYLTIGIHQGCQTRPLSPAHAAIPRIVDCRRIRATVIVPVHDAYDMFLDCVRSVLRHTRLDDRNRLLVIDDASSDPRMAALLSTLAALPGVVVERNAENLGYTRTVNRGIDLASDSDVVLLNSDTVVGPHWLRNLKVAAYRHDRTGTVTAVSDNAGEFSIPRPGANAPVEGFDVDMLARIAADASDGVLVEAPTGNGFCMYIKRALIDVVGTFDADLFPEGYGEENDLCMRAIAAGWSNVVAPGVYVRHVRSASFGERRQRLSQAGLAQVLARHPHYLGAIRAIGSAPTFAAARYRYWVRLRSLIQSGRRPKPRVMYVISTRVGGTPQTNADLMRALAQTHDVLALACDRHVLEVLRVVESGYEVLEKYSLADPITFATHVSGEYDDIVRFILLKWGVDLLHVRHLAWHGLGLIEVANSLDVPVVMSFHDYYAICPTVTLLDEEGVLHPRGVAERGGNPLWHDDPTAEPMDAARLAAWQARMQQVLRGAAAFVTTSPGARSLLCEALPLLKERADDFHVIPHGRDLNTSQRARPTPHEGPLRVLVPGNLSAHKGAVLLRELKTRDVGNRLEVHVVGSCPAELRGFVIEHGTYDRCDFDGLVASIAPDVAAILSIWPETYCHTLTECWASGLPVIGVDIGAVGERVREHGGGWLLGFPTTVEALERTLCRIADDSADRAARLGEVALWQATEAAVRTTSWMADRYRALYGTVAHPEPAVGFLPDQGA